MSRRLVMCRRCGHIATWHALQGLWVIRCTLVDCDCRGWEPARTPLARWVARRHRRAYLRVLGVPEHAIG
jgi:6-phosphofructokinase